VVFGGQDQRLEPFGDTWLYGNNVSASSQTIGSGCAGTNGRPVLVSGPPFLGNQDFVFDVLSARALAPVLVMIANDTQVLQLGGGCTFYLRGSVVPLFGASNATGFSSIRLAIPYDPSLRGVPAYAQGFVVDPLGSFANLAFTAGVWLVLGD
jgi:hypothetical protein